MKLIVLNKVDGSFVFSYETDGSMAPGAVFNSAIEELKSRFTDLGDDLDEHSLDSDTRPSAILMILREMA